MNLSCLIKKLFCHTKIFITKYDGVIIVISIVALVISIISTNLNSKLDIKLLPMYNCPTPTIADIVSAEKWNLKTEHRYRKNNELLIMYNDIYYSCGVQNASL